LKRQIKLNEKLRKLKFVKKVKTNACINSAKIIQYTVFLSSQVTFKLVH